MLIDGLAEQHEHAFSAGRVEHPVERWLGRELAERLLDTGTPRRALRRWVPRRRVPLVVDEEHRVRSLDPATMLRPRLERRRPVEANGSPAAERAHLGALAVPVHLEV